MATILLTGFEPFDKHSCNPSQQVVERLDGRTIGGATVVGLTLPVVFGEDTRRVFAAIDEHKPSVVLSLGLHAGRPCIDVEAFAINRRRMDAGDGEEPIIADGPAAYFATIDVESIGCAIGSVGVPVQKHGYAGNYLCNHILYQTLHLAATRNLPFTSGFLHLPLSDEQMVIEGITGQPSLPLDLIVSGVESAIEATL